MSSSSSESHSSLESSYSDSTSTVLECSMASICSSSISSPEPLSSIPQPSSRQPSPVSNPVLGCQTLLQSTLSKVRLPNASWINQASGLDHVAICKVSDQPSSSRQTLDLVITFCVIVRNDLSWSLSVHGHQIDLEQQSNRFLSNVPMILSEESLQELLLLLDRCSVCPGNPDNQYILMVEAMKGKLMSLDRKTIIASVDDFFEKTIRVSNCELLLTASIVRCKACVAYRNTLRARYHWWSKRNCSPSHRQCADSRVNLCWLNTPEKAVRYGKLRSKLDAKSRQVKHLKERIGKLLERSGVSLHPAIQSDFTGIMSEMTSKVQQECPEGSFKRIFWDQQIQACKVSNKKQLRLHPAMIKWCLHLKFISSGCYHALRASGLITLPSERTLRDYTHWIRAGVGFIPEVDTQLIWEASVAKEKDRFVVLVWDEMKVHEDLVFDKA